MRQPRFLAQLFTVWVLAFAGPLGFPAGAPCPVPWGTTPPTAGRRLAQFRAGSIRPNPTPSAQEPQGAAPATEEEHLRIETEHGALHFWIPGDYAPRSAGMVIYVHGYYTTVDQTWEDDHLAAQFRQSGRNALFVAIDAPMSNFQDVSWKSFDELLRTVKQRAPFALPRGPVIVVAHSGGFRTTLLWLRDPRVQYVILLDGLYAGESEYRYWLRPHRHVQPHRLVLVASDTWRQSNQLARHVYGTARRRGIPAQASDFTRRDARARLLYLRSQYNHMEMVTGGKVIPVLLQISPLAPLPAHSPKKPGPPATGSG